LLSKQIESKLSSIVIYKDVANYKIEEVVNSIINKQKKSLIYSNLKKKDCLI